MFTAGREVARQVRRANEIALFLDFDGTLAAIRAHPQEVWLPQSARLLLTRLARRPHLTVTIISGRTLDDVRRRARVPGARYLGLHGWETQNGRSPAPQRIFRQLKRIQSAMKKQLRGLSGIWLEDKKYGFVIHFRRAEHKTVLCARRRFRSVLAPYAGDFRVLRGKKIWEVLPRDAPDKGTAAKRLLAQLPQSTLPIYIGDDRTDEDAFRALERGITVKVGVARRTHARYWVRNPEEVLQFLARLEGICGGRKSRSAS